MTFFVVWTLLTYMGEAGEAFPSMITLADQTGTHERTVRDHLDRAVASGFLRMRRDGRRKTNVYKLASEILSGSSDRVSGPGQSNHVFGSATPVSRRVAALHERAHSDTESPFERVIGAEAQSERVNGSKVTGAADPTIQIEDIHVEDPRQRSLVRSPFGRSDESGEELIGRLAQRVFHHTHGLGRKRSRKNRIAEAFRKLADDGADLERAVQGTIAIMQGSDARNPDLGGHAAAEKILRERRWETWAEDERSPAFAWDEDEDASAFL